jgi:hypothetical protein
MDMANGVDAFGINNFREMQSIRLCLGMLALTCCEC